MSDTKIKTSNIGNLAVTHALLHTDMDLTSKTVQVATPTSNTHPATKAYVDTEVANLIDSAPGTLDTLNELAAAVNDDANFNATIASSIATKLPLAGGTMTGNLTAPNIIATGDVFISSTSPKLKLTDTDTADEYTELQNNNGNTIIDTRNGTENGQFIIRGLGGGTVDEFGRFDELGRFGIGTTNPDHLLHVGNILNSLGTTAGDSLSNFRIQSDTSHNDSLLFTAQRLADGTTWTTAAQRIQRRVDTTLMGYMEFGHNIDALITFGKGSTERVRIDGDGNVGIGDNSPAEKFTIKGDGARMTISSNDYEVAMLGRRGSSAPDWDRGYLRMKYDGTNTIVLDTGGVSYLNGGNVGIGTTSPEQNLHIKRSSGSDTGGQGHIVLDVADDSGPAYALRIGDTADDGDFHIDRRHSSTWSSSLSIDRATGNVGIGTNNPTEKLHVSSGSFKIDTDTNSTFKISDAGTNAIALYGGTGDELYMGANNAYSLRFKTDGNIVMDNGGNFGIGIANPDSLLHIQKAVTNSDVDFIKIQMDSWSQSVGKLKSIVWDDGTNVLAGIGTEFDGGKANIHFHSQYTGGYQATSVRTLSVLGDGKVGIGTDNPQAKLNISGSSANIRLDNTGTGNYGLEIWRNGNKGASFAWGEGNANLEIKNYRNDSQADGPYANIDFFTGGTNATSPNYNPDLRMRIQQTGEVGIGTSNPTAKLHVEGTIYADNGQSVKSVTTVGTGISGCSRQRFFRHISTGVGSETFTLMRYARHWWGVGWFQIIVRGTYYGTNSKYGVFTINGHTRTGLASVQSHINNVGTATPFADNYNSTHEACDISITLPAYEQYNIEFNILQSEQQSSEANVGHHVGASNAFFLHGTVREFI